MPLIIRRLKRTISEPREALRRLSELALLVAHRLGGRPYHTFYARVVDRVASSDPRGAIGALWDEMGTLQFDFLVAAGLRPEHQLLDFGCGCLRGGLHFIRYLEPGRYTGVDISAVVLEAGRQFLREEGLEAKRPDLVHTTDLSLREFQGRRFDFILAQSVLTHMPEKEIGELFHRISSVMKPESRFFATYLPVGADRRVDVLEFHYPLATLQGLGGEAGLLVEPVAEFAHPRKQQMLRITLQSPVGVAASP
jgi:SAM-dependent methyltransferase